MNNKTLATFHAAAIRLLVERVPNAEKIVGPQIIMLAAENWAASPTVNDGTAQLLNDARFTLMSEWRALVSEKPVMASVLFGAGKTVAECMELAERALAGFEAAANLQRISSKGLVCGSISFGDLSDIEDNFQSLLIMDGFDFSKNDRGYFVILRNIDERGARKRNSKTKKHERKN